MKNLKKIDNFSLNVLKCDYPYRFTLFNIPKYITQFFRNIKWAYQRVVYGFCERDTFSLDMYYSHLLYYTLTYFSENLMGYPTQFKDENEWKKYLQTMAAHFYNGIEGAPGIWTTEKKEKLWDELWGMTELSNVLDPKVFKDGYTQEDYEKLLRQCLDAEVEADRYALEETKKGFDMLMEIYPNLWD